MRKIALSTTVAAIVGATTLAVSATAAGTTGSPEQVTATGLATQVLHLSAHCCDAFHAEDVPPRGDSPGDQFTFAATWFNGAERVASVGTTCTIVRSQPRSEPQCAVTARFATGLLTAEGMSGDFRSETPSVLAITGGTGRFSSAVGGEIVVTGTGQVTIRLRQLR